DGLTAINGRLPNVKAASTSRPMEDHRTAVRRRLRPVAVDLGIHRQGTLIAAVGLHSPDVPSARAIGVKQNVPAIGGCRGGVISARAGRQLLGSGPGGVARPEI